MFRFGSFAALVFVLPARQWFKFAGSTQDALSTAFAAAIVNDFDPYNVLGVSRDATPSEIKRAYRNLSRASHPDRKTARGVANAANSEASPVAAGIGDTNEQESARINDNRSQTTWKFEDIARAYEILSGWYP
jgi:preprotein translocase subunit Sec63